MKMRLDKFLKVSRLVKRRTVANELCDAGRVAANGRKVKASYEVKEGDILEIGMGGRTRMVKVLKTTSHALKEDAKGMYEEITEGN